MFKKTTIILFATFLVLFSFSPVMAAELSSVEYTLSGDSSDIDTLELEPQFLLSGRHPATLNLAFDGDDFYFAGDMELNLLRENNFRMDLHMMLASEVNNHDFGKAVGLSAATGNNDFSIFWQTHYFIDEDLDDHAYYKGGIKYGLGPSSDIVFSFANQYWDLDNDVVKIGINFKM